MFDKDGYFCSVAVLNSVTSRNAFKCLLLDTVGYFVSKNTATFHQPPNVNLNQRSFLTLSKIDR